MSVLSGGGPKRAWGPNFWASFVASGAVLILAVARVDGRFGRLTASWARIDVLVIDLSRPRD